MTAYHAKYFAHDITRQAPPGAVDQLSMSLFDASVDLNPHHIEVALFALQSPSEGVLLADEELRSGHRLQSGRTYGERIRRPYEPVLILQGVADGRVSVDALSADSQGNPK